MKIRLITPLLIIAATFSLFLATSTAQAAPVVGFEPGRIIDDDVFTAYGSMGVSQIQSFLNSKVPTCDTWGTQPSEFGGGTRAQWGTSQGYPPPYTCLKDFNEGGRSAAQIIYDSAQQYHINPQVMIVLLQKEQALTTDTWPLSRQYRTATGYGCPDTAACDSQYYGFTNQVNRANNMFRSIIDASPGWYTPYVMGNNTIKWNPQASCGSSVVNIETRATQALYNYTPYRPNQAALDAGYGTGNSCSSYGNRNFYLYFTDWFGSTKGNAYYVCKNSTNVSGSPSGVKVIPNQFTATGNARFSMTIPNNTGTACIEIHTWGDNQQAWITNVATNHPAIDPNEGEIINANLYGDAKDEMVFVKYQNTGSGRIEIHTWDTTYQRWVSNVATNHPSISPADGRVIAADVNGDGRDELVFVKYQNNGSGRIEVHTWAAGQQSWISNVATNHPSVSPTDGRVIGADVTGDGRDELVFVKYQNTGSGRIEVHTWAAGQQSWISNVATNHPVIAPGDFEAVAGNIYGGKPDEIALVKYRNTGSGRIEIHTWAPGQQSWLSNVATSVSQLP
jgi:hypothetical protein